MRKFTSERKALISKHFVRKKSRDLSAFDSECLRLVSAMKNPNWGGVASFYAAIVRVREMSNEH